MSETKWTPGEWEVGLVVAVNAATGEETECKDDAIVFIYTLECDDEALCEIRVQGLDALPNAHLCAAAPDLYATLAEIRQWMDAEMGAWDAKFIAQIDALLSRARGEQP
jgi:hypothetical protein